MHDVKRGGLHAMARVHNDSQVTNDEILTGGKIVAQQVDHDIEHGRRLKGAADESHQENDKRKKRKNGIGRDGKSEGVNLGPHQVFDGAKREMRIAMAFPPWLRD